MPATAFSSTTAALAALLVHSIVPVDSDIGCTEGLDGLLLSNGFTMSPSRDRVTHKNHRGLDVMSVSTNPALTMSFDAKITQIAGAFSAKHPGTAIDISVITMYTSANAHGFPTGGSGTNWWELLPPSFGAPAGDLSTTRFDLKLWAPSYASAGAYVYA